MHHIVDTWHMPVDTIWTEDAEDDALDWLETMATTRQHLQIEMNEFLTACQLDRTYVCHFL